MAAPIFGQPGPNTDINVPVLVGLVPLFRVTSFVLSEGYETVRLAKNPRFVQLLRPSTKTVTIKALLIREFRALRPALEAMAMTSRAFASPVGALTQFTGIPVISKTFFSLDMQITKLDFTQNTEMKDTLNVSITLTHIPRSSATELVSAGVDTALAVGMPFVPI